MGKYMSQGDKTWTLDGGVTAPIGDRGGASILKEAAKPTSGIVGMKGIGKNGVPIKGGK